MVTATPRRHTHCSFTRPDRDRSRTSGIRGEHRPPCATRVARDPAHQGARSRWRPP
ncbi:hypothetical protein CZ771_11345 [Actinomycetales bacterium JB111]|nr:hypothetical protein CZ771_11345 [Actinomycetales bacterium JB111]